MMWIKSSQFVNLSFLVPRISPRLAVVAPAAVRLLTVPRPSSDRRGVLRAVDLLAISVHILRRTARRAPHDDDDSTEDDITTYHTRPVFDLILSCSCFSLLTKCRLAFCCSGPLHLTLRPRHGLSRGGRGYVRGHHTLVSWACLIFLTTIQR